MKIDFAKLTYQYNLYKEEIDEAIAKVLNHGKYIMGPEINELEDKLCEFTGAKNTVTCSSGTDALLLAMMALDIEPGDEIITTPFTFIATAETIALLKAKPVFVDIDETTYNIDPKKIEEKITYKTKGIISVSLYGQPSDLDEINEIARNIIFFILLTEHKALELHIKRKRKFTTVIFTRQAFSQQNLLGVMEMEERF